jgi:hypothetical protein
MKNITELRNKLLEMEGGKQQVNVAQMSEVLAKLSDLLYAVPTKEYIKIMRIIVANGNRRSRSSK